MSFVIPQGLNSNFFFFIIYELFFTQLYCLSIYMFSFWASLMPPVFRCWILISRNFAPSLCQTWMYMHVWFVGNISKGEGRNLMHTHIALKQVTMSTLIFRLRKFTAFLMDMKLLTHLLMTYGMFWTQGRSPFLSLSLSFCVCVCVCVVDYIIFSYRNHLNHFFHLNSKILQYG